MSDQTTPFGLLQGSVIMVFSSASEAQAEYDLCKALFERCEHGEAEFHGFRMKTKTTPLSDWSSVKQPLAPWFIPKHNCLIFALHALPEKHDGYSRTGNILLSTWPPMVVGNDVSNYGLHSSRARAAIIPATQTEKETETKSKPLADVIAFSAHHPEPVLVEAVA